jgi:hypothetical protein
VVPAVPDEELLCVSSGQLLAGELCLGEIDLIVLVGKCQREPAARVNGTEEDVGGGVPHLLSRVEHAHDSGHLDGGGRGDGEKGEGVGEVRDVSEVFAGLSLLIALSVNSAVY